MARHQSNIDAAFLYGCLDFPLVHFRDSQHDLRVSFPPPKQQAAKRFADRRHAHRQAHFAHYAGAVLIAGMSDRIELSQCAPDVRQHRLAPAGQPNPAMPALEQCKTELVLKSSHAATYRGRSDLKGLGGAREVARGCRCLQIHEVTDIHVPQALQIYLLQCRIGSRAGVDRRAIQSLALAVSTRPGLLPAADRWPTQRRQSLRWGLRGGLLRP